MANRHFGMLADVWKHLVLAEVLSVDRPRQFCDTHAGHACYAMRADAERRYGVLGFMEAAVDDVVLKTSAYFRLLVGQRGGVGELSDYPAGPMLAMLELGASSEYLFCDLDPESCANICEVALRLGLESMVRVVEGDGMTAVREAVGDQARGTLVYTDPFRAPSRLTRRLVGTRSRPGDRRTRRCCRVLVWLQPGRPATVDLRTRTRQRSHDRLVVRGLDGLRSQRRYA